MTKGVVTLKPPRKQIIVRQGTCLFGMPQGATLTPRKLP